MVPRDVKNINAKDEMPGRIKEDQSGIESWRRKALMLFKVNSDEQKVISKIYKLD